MRVQIKPKKKIDIKDLYALKVSALWGELKQQHISFWFLCLYFLFEYTRPQVLYPVLDVLPWGMLSLLLTLITVFLNKSIVSLSNPLNKLIIAFSFIVILSGIFAFNSADSWEYKEAMLGWVIVYFLVINIVNTERRLILFIAAYLLLNLKMAQFGSIIWVKSGFSFVHTGLNGAPGWFTNSGEYAIQMLIYGSLALAFVISLSSYFGRYKRWILYAAAIMGYFAVMGASSRGSQFALAIIAVWFLIKQKNGFKGIMALIVLSIALFYLLPEEQIQRFQGVGEDRSSLQRLAYVDVGLEIIKEHPVLGVGYNNWISYMQFMYPNGVGIGQTIQESHNIYIQAASELGLLGLMCFLLMIIFAFINNSRTRKMAEQINNKLFYNLSYGLDAGLIGYLVAGTFVTVLYYPFFWIQITMIVMLNSVTKSVWLNITKKKSMVSRKVNDNKIE
jgi:putative inorganic carbon (HCO3(-)) transporter